ncbi:PRC and DUF2382 domain-containing protein [Leucobacter sp. CSA1]|uniref:PRC and DUF2382 domain-containing protein n=1 Tax=Leucobacter chromiisoli TaxID=2796471 RepID=A0A934QC81_9MICO|nr:PRC and DUF2382 domain-containing protein [Leucobacter chromiisoli]MBK0420412.1 PRC and DUF2382 domain-containing protein [Leucobacter chromiisoli]
MIDSSNINSIFDARVLDRDGAKIGTVKQVYVDSESGRPLFTSVSTGLFGTSESLVPLQGATFDGDCLRVGYEKDTVKDAPRIDADGVLSDEEQDRLWDYYADDSADGDGNGETGFDDDARVRDTRDARGAHGADGEPLVGGGARSEERRDLGGEGIPTGRVRLRKVVVTEQRNITVPVQHEEVVLERDSIADENGDDARRGRDLPDDELQATLHEEPGEVVDPEADRRH